KLRRVDGAAIAKSLHAKFEQDLREWLYDRIWSYFSGIPEENWSEDESFTAEINCREMVSLFQSTLAGLAAKERGYVPVESAAWFTYWLLRLNLGDQGAKEASDGWSDVLKGKEHEGQLALLTAALSKFLPEIQGQVFLLNLYAPTLDLRVKATTAWLFDD